MWSEWINTVCQTLRYMVEWKGRDTEEDPGSAGWLDNVTDDCYHRGWSIVEATHLATDIQRWRTYGCHSVPRHRHDNNKKFHTEILRGSPRPGASTREGWAKAAEWLIGSHIWAFHWHQDRIFIVTRMVCLNWFESYLTSRSFRVKCDKHFSSEHISSCGVP